MSSTSWQASKAGGLQQRREPLQAALSSAARGQLESLGLGWERRWVTALHADLQTPGSNTFLSTLDSMLRKPGQVRAELDVFFDVLAALRQELLRDVEDRERCRRIEDLLHAARFLTSSASEWLEVNRWLTSNETLQGASALERARRSWPRPRASHRHPAPDCA